MTLYTVQLKLTSPILGSVRNQTNNYRTLLRNPKGNVIIPQSHWYWGVKEALLTLRKDKEVDVDCVRDLLPYAPPTTHAYERKHQKKSEMFESIRTGTVITTQLLIASLSPEEQAKAFSIRKRPPDIKDVESILRFTGAFIGITQWGYKFGYGRFTPIYIEESTPQEIEKAITEVHFVNAEIKQ